MKLLAFIAPSIVAGLVASLCVGAIEAAMYGVGVYDLLVATGYLSIVAAPTGIALSLLVRGVVRAWGAGAVAEQFVRDDGGAPRLAALLFTAIVCTLGFAGLLHFYLTSLLGRTRVPLVVVLAGTIGAVVVLALVASLSRPIYRVVAAVATRLELRRGGDGPFLTIKRVTIATLLLIGLSAVLLWLLVVSPAIGDLDSRPIYLLLGAFALMVVIHLLWPRVSKRVRMISLVAVGALSTAVLTVSIHARSADTDALLAVWGEQPLAGKAVDFVFNIGQLVEARNRAAIAPSPISQTHPDILLVTLDTVRADKTGPYGGDELMPTLKGLASRGTIFEWAFSAGNVTRRSLATLATGLSPHRAKGRLVGWSLKLDPRHITLAERLRAAGYDTAGFFWSDKFFGPRRFGGGIDHAEYTRDGDASLAKRARDWIRAHHKRSPLRPTFVWVHLFDPHDWNKAKIKPPAGLKGIERRLWKYNRALRNTDNALRVLLDESVSTTNPAGRIVIVTADHGEGLGEHGSSYHSTDLYNSQIRVPLIVSGNGVVRRRITQTVGHADVVPTVLELAGYEPISMPETDGTSLATLALGTSEQDIDGGFAHSSMVADRSVRQRSDAIISGRYKLIENVKKTELFDIRADPNELENLSARLGDVMARLRKELGVRQRRERISPFRPRR